MDPLVVYESIYGNTRAVAEAVAEGLGGAEVVPVHEATGRPETDRLLIVGGPTHIHGMSTSRSRQMAVQAVDEDGDPHHVEPGAAQEPGLRAWIRDLPEVEGSAVATFDTRIDKSPWMTGAASRGMAKRLRRRGYEVVAMESFLVEDSEGPLVGGELERARAWGAEIGKRVAPRVTEAAR